MSLERVRTGWHVTTRTHAVFRDQPVLLGVVLVEFLALAAALSVGMALYFTSTAVLALGRTLAIALAFGVGAATVGLLLGYGNAVLAAYTSRLLTDDGPGIAPSVAVATRRLPQLVVHALVWGLFGFVLGLLERHKQSGDGTAVARYLFGASFRLATFFVVPGVVVDDVPARRMYQHSIGVVEERFGDTAVIALGIFTLFTAVGAVPFILTQVWLIGSMLLIESGVAPALGNAMIETLRAHTPLLGGVAVVAFGLLYVVGSAYATVAKTALYHEYTDRSLGTYFADGTLADAIDRQERESSPSDAVAAGE